MEVETDLSQKIVEIFHNIYAFFSEQDTATYSLILILVALTAFTTIYIIKNIQLMKNCLYEVDHRGFHKINFLNLISVLLASGIYFLDTTIAKVFCGAFIIPVVAYFVFTIKLFVSNVTRFRNKKNFVKRKKKKADIDKQLGLRNRVAKNDLTATYESASNMYTEVQSEEQSLNTELRKNRLNSKSLSGRDGLN